MNGELIKMLGLFAMVGLTSACGSTSKHAQFAAPLPPTNIEYDKMNGLTTIQPALGQNDIVLSASEKSKSCSFSSFHRKHAFGYEMDESTHMGLTFSPNIDVFNLSDADFKVGLNFTMALGGKANKRPDCTYGKGYYGFLPYAMNDGVNLSGLTNMTSIKGFVQEKLNERERRHKLRESKSLRGI